MKDIKMDGISFMLVIGRYGGFSIIKRKETGSLRICIGWIALAIYFYDVEVAVGKLVKETKNGLN